ncbi:hypothetical protein GYMLUDRAFT_246374 [Collybiopsis luxurians FD-317 M1]|uniref:Uncharacterized protein n=1 Tax=Collybiopsis luxurians FD-317 M1 TaxID=944289 RepID=A0A0D0CIA7_9AGAR|nr:hypothetical protein GYMLUDRAFT_246374 [Collybiopsis luxurians FD-317 M1]
MDDPIALFNWLAATMPYWATLSTAEDKAVNKSKKDLCAFVPQTQMPTNEISLKMYKHVKTRLRWQQRIRLKAPPPHSSIRPTKCDCDAEASDASWKILEGNGVFLGLFLAALLFGVSPGAPPLLRVRVAKRSTCNPYLRHPSTWPVVPNPGRTGVTCALDHNWVVPSSIYFNAGAAEVSKYSPVYRLPSAERSTAPYPSLCAAEVSKHNPVYRLPSAERSTAPYPSIYAAEDQLR